MLSCCGAPWNLDRWPAESIYLWCQRLVLCLWGDLSSTVQQIRRNNFHAHEIRSSLLANFKFQSDLAERRRCFGRLMPLPSSREALLTVRRVRPLALSSSKSSKNRCSQSDAVLDIRGESFQIICGWAASSLATPHIPKDFFMFDCRLVPHLIQWLLS